MASAGNVGLASNMPFGESALGEDEEYAAELADEDLEPEDGQEGQEDEDGENDQRT